jgi:hypothetical protein
MANPANSSNQTNQKSKKKQDKDAKYNRFLAKKRRYSSRKSGDYQKSYRAARKTHAVFRYWELIYANFFNGYAVQADKGPLMKDDVIRLVQTVATCYLTHSKVFTCRVDLYFPAEWDTEKRLALDYYSRFIKSLGEQMSVVENELRSRGRSDGKSNERDLFVQHFRAMEFGEGKGRKKKHDENDQDKGLKERGVHIHALLMFNGHQFTSLGDLTDLSKNGLGRMIMAAWASALFGYSRTRPQGIEPSDWRYTTPNWQNLEEVQKQGLVNFARTWAPSMHPDPVERERRTRFQIGSIIFAASYLCKAYTKIKLPKESGFFKMVSGGHLPRLGVERAKRLHRLQIELPLYTRGDLREFWELEGWEPETVEGGYISADLKCIAAYLTEFKASHSTFIAIEKLIKIPEQYVEVKGKSFSDVLTHNFLTEVGYWFRRQRVQPEKLIGGLYKEVIGAQRQRYLHWVLLVDNRLYQQMISHRQYDMERHLVRVGQRILDGWGGGAQMEVRLNEVIKYHDGSFMEGDFHRVMNLCSSLAISRNTPSDLVMPFVKTIAVG